MDADRRIIDIVDDDQGEGIKDPMTVDDLIEAGFFEKVKEHEQEFHKAILGNMANDSIFTKTASKIPKDHLKTVRWAPEKRFDRKR